MILHFSHIGFTDARTFIALEFVSKKDTRRSQEMDRGQGKTASWPTGKDSKAGVAPACGRRRSRLWEVAPDRDGLLEGRAVLERLRLDVEA